ncbi:hypothetical protein AAG570_005599 [Ranatra chinensis]|uniref:Neuronal membrane glycoprotein M6-b n=1 Tax=Ranatra chinensis TaxID=642074 RepID=A0ABD0YGA2_9HEMI
MSRIPYATLIATVMCIIGGLVFCGSMYRGSTLTALMLDNVFHLRVHWFEPMQITFIAVGGSMLALALMILFVGFLATGATRVKVYRAWGARVGGRISCAIFICITYLLLLVWLVVFIFLVLVTAYYTVSWALCSSSQVQNEGKGIDFRQFRFLFPEEIDEKYLLINPPNEIKLFCKDTVEKAEAMFILATFSSLLIILSLVHFLVCLSANYAHIRDHEKLQELQELQYLNDPDLTSSKDRF